MRQSVIFVSLFIVWLAGAGELHAAESRCAMTPQRIEEVAARLPEGIEVDFFRLRDFYALENGGCVWSPQQRDALLEALGRVWSHGLSPSLFHLQTLKQLSPGSDTSELLMSDAALRYVRVMTAGRVPPAALAKEVSVPPLTMDAAGALATGLDARDFAAWLEQLPPRDPAYHRLRFAYEAYRVKMEDAFHPLSLGGVRALHEGDRSPVVPQLAARLVRAGEASSLPSGTLYTPEIEAAVRRYQTRHGLKVDGVVGRNTLAQLNTPPARRVEQIALNLERWRVLAHALPLTRIEVNAAAAQLNLIRDGRTELSMRAIVGAKKTQTPIIVSRAQAVVANPPWNVPSSITKNELLPKIAKDDTYLERKHMEWVDGRIVQSPGDHNALGRLKIDFPSRYAVYMHDTNARSLFARDYRWLSHGCIRLQKPRELADILLGGGDARKEIDRLIDEEETVRVPVAEQLPVAVVYWTAFVAEDGTMNFRNDVYGRDDRLKAALRGAGGSDVPARPVEACGM